MLLTNLVAKNALDRHFKKYLDAKNLAWLATHQ